MIQYTQKVALKECLDILLRIDSQEGDPIEEVIDLIRSFTDD